MPSKSQQGGDLFTDVRNLAIPFSFLIAQKGIEYMASKRPASAKGRSRMAGGSSGHEGCALCAAASSQAGGRSSAKLSHSRVAAEFQKLSSDLQGLLNSYKEHLSMHSQ